MQVLLIIVTYVAAEQRSGTPTRSKKVVFLGIEFLIIIAALVVLQRGFLDVALGVRKTLRGGLVFIGLVFAGAAIAAIAGTFVR